MHDLFQTYLVRSASVCCCRHANKLLLLVRNLLPGSRIPLGDSYVRDLHSKFQTFEMTDGYGLRSLYLYLSRESCDFDNVWCTE